MSTPSMPGGSDTSSTLPRTSVITSEKPLASTIAAACSMISEHSTPMTRRAPAFAANMDRMAVPQPTSSTTLPRKRCALSRIARSYARVRTSSLSISCEAAVRRTRRVARPRGLERAARRATRGARRRGHRAWGKRR